MMHRLLRVVESVAIAFGVGVALTTFGPDSRPEWAALGALMVSLGFLYPATRARRALR
jgi:hypothetical protein